MIKRILTGDRPTGPLHLGHYVGSLQNRVRLQEEYDTYLLIADIQALTDNFEHPEKLEANIFEVALDYLAVGLDPDKVKIVVQSMVPELTELTIYFMNLVTTATLERNPTLKDEIKQRNFTKGLPVGFYTYPISQASDITIFKAHLVPVGEDQLPMIEQAREIVRRFNRMYDKVLIEPKALVGEVARLPGTDGGAKMSKSLGNCIYLGDSPQVLRQRVMSMFTDTKRLHADDPGTVEGNPVFTYLDVFDPNQIEVEDLKERYRRGKVRDVEVKAVLFRALNNFLAPIRDRRRFFADRPHQVHEILMEGTKKGREVARETMIEVREAMHLRYALDFASVLQVPVVPPLAHVWKLVHQRLGGYEEGVWTLVNQGATGDEENIKICWICGAVRSLRGGRMRSFVERDEGFIESYNTYVSEPSIADKIGGPCEAPNRNVNLAALEQKILKNPDYFYLS